MAPSCIQLLLGKKFYIKQNKDVGFGFNLFFVFILLPLTFILLLVWSISGKVIFGKITLILWLGLIGLVVLSGAVRAPSTKDTLNKSDFYSHYIIDRKRYPGMQADWQYESFRFQINSDNTIDFYVMNKGTILETFKGRFATTKPYSSETPIVNMEQPTHHILSTSPTVYRISGGFYLVLNLQSLVMYSSKKASGSR